MQVTFNSEEPLDQVLSVVESLYGVRLSVETSEGDDGGERTVKTRHFT